MIERTHGKVFIVADLIASGKFVANNEIAKIDEIQAIITDSKLDPEAQAALRARWIEILFADKHLTESRA